MFIRSVVSVAALVGLAACGGSGASNLGRNFDLSPPSDAEYAELAAAAVALASYNPLNPNNISGPELDLPSGPEDVNFSGVMVLGQSLEKDKVEGPGYLGQVQLVVNFAGRTIGGEATNFYKTDLNQGGLPINEGDQMVGDKLFLSNDTWVKDPVTEETTFELDVNGDLDTMQIIGTLDEGTFQVTAVPDSPAGIYAANSSGNELTVVGSAMTFDAVVAAD